MANFAAAALLNASSPVPLRRAYPVQEACLLIGIGKSHLYELIASGKIKSIKIGGRRLIPSNEIDRVSIEGA